MVYQKGGMLAFLCLLCLHYSQSSSLPVPVLSWSNSDRIYEVPAVTYGQTDELSGIYKKYIEPMIKRKSLVLLFLQDELSNDDFTKYSSSFPHLQKVLEKKKYLLFPSVSKEKSIDELISGSTKDIEYVGSSSLNDWNYKLPSDSNTTKVIVFHLEPVSGSHSKGKGQILERNDLIMHRIIKTLNGQVKDFDIVYTAEDPSMMVANFLLDEKIAEVGFGSRHLLSETEHNNTEKFFNNSCILMYATSIKYSSKDINITEFITPNATVKVGGCGSNKLGGCISLTFGDIVGIVNATLLIEFKNGTQEWYCESIYFSGHTNENMPFESKFNCGNDNSSTGFDSPVYDTIRAPIGMSYACQTMTFIYNQTNPQAAGQLILSGFQVQTFCDGRGMTPAQFSGAYDCVGFFTIEILTGIFVTVILMIGLYIGITMIMAIQVQDRFDDPKGKTLNTVTINE